MRLRWSCFAAALAVLFALTPAARACSCLAPRDPRESFEQAPAAFIGRALRQPTPTPSPTPTSSYGPAYGGRDDIRFAVDEDFKVDLPDEITVHGASSPCGFGAKFGDTVAMYLYRDNGRWASSSCDQTTPDALRKAAAPLPTPDGSGAPRFILGGSMGPVRTFSLDARGRTLAYARAPGDTSSLDLCPGSDVVAELVRGVVRSDYSKMNVATRDVRTLVARTEYGFTSFDTKSGNSMYAGPIACLDQQGRALAVFGVHDSRAAKIVRVSGEDETAIWEGRADAIDFSDDAPTAFVASDTDLLRIDLSTGAERKVATIPEGTARVDVSPDDLHALYSSRGADNRPDQKGHYVLDLTTGRSQRLPLKLYGYVWAGTHEFIAVTKDAAVHVYDVQLEETATWPEWGEGGVVDDGMLYASTYTGLRAASVRDGSPHVVRKFDFPQTFDLVVVRAPKRQASAASPSVRPSPTAVPTLVARGTPAPQALPSTAPASGTPAPAFAVFTAAIAVAGIAYVLKRRRPADR